ncbi:MAG TPA: SDR family oxidoreductase [Mycobacteriales bacterium]|nr:SDR family oxidoreductase [Mycobacteriales bacterium]
MGALDGRVAVITGAGRGIGREHALLFAREGAAVVVNDLGGANDGSGADTGPAQEVVAEIKAFGGHAVANTDNVATWDGAKALVDQAVEEFGTLNVVVNNAGILRDSFIAGMSEQQWDDVISVHLKGHFCVLRHAAEYWKEQSKAGADVNAAILNTSSGSGTTLPNAGQVNYGAAKAGIAAMTLVAAVELGRYGVRANAITPLARTRLTLATPGIDQLMAKPEADDTLDSFDPAAISPLVAYLCSASCTLTGKVYEVSGASISELSGWTYGRKAETDKPWTIAEVEQRLTAWGE